MEWPTQLGRRRTMTVPHGHDDEDEQLNLYSEIIARFDSAPEPRRQKVVATAGSRGDAKSPSRRVSVVSASCVETRRAWSHACVLITAPDAGLDNVVGVGLLARQARQGGGRN